MDINSEKIELVKLLLATEDPSKLNAIRAIFNSENPKGFWHDYSEEQQKEIDDASKQLSSDGSDTLTNHDF
jgi:hypothetical protein